LTPVNEKPSPPLTAAASSLTHELSMPQGPDMRPSVASGSLAEGSLAVIAQTTAHGSGAATATATVADRIGAQIAHRISAGGQGAPGGTGTAQTGMDLVLSPPELGRVAIRFDGGQDMGTLVLQVDRPETLELMRRHLDVLAEALRQAGQGGCTVSLGGRDPGQGRQGMPVPSSPGPTQSGEGASDSGSDRNASANAQAPGVGSTRLDLRF